MPAQREAPVDEWAYLNEEVLLKSRSRKVCMICHRFRHRGAELHPGAQLIAPPRPDHPNGSTLPATAMGGLMKLQRGWEPEVALSDEISGCRIKKECRCSATEGDLSVRRTPLPARAAQRT